MDIFKFAPHIAFDLNTDIMLCYVLLSDEQGDR